MALRDGVSVSIAAAATTNVFLNRPIEFLGVPSNITLLAAADAALQTGQVLINVGGQQLVPVAAGTPINTASAAGAGPKNDEDVLQQYAVPAGARSQFNITNGAGAAVISRYGALITP